jgi:hypothetical protein
MELFDYDDPDITIAMPEVETPEADTTPGLTPGVPGLALPTGTAPR